MEFGFSLHRTWVIICIPKLGFDTALPPCVSAHCSSRQMSNYLLTARRVHAAVSAIQAIRGATWSDFYQPDHSCIALASSQERRFKTKQGWEGGRKVGMSMGLIYFPTSHKVCVWVWVWVCTSAHSWKQCATVSFSNIILSSAHGKKHCTYSGALYFYADILKWLPMRRIMLSAHRHCL